MDVAARAQGLALGIGEWPTTLPFKLVNLLVGLEIPPVSEPLEEHQREDVGLVILPGCPAAQDFSGAPLMGFKLLLGETAHLRSYSLLADVPLREKRTSE